MMIFLRILAIWFLLGLLICSRIAASINWACVMRRCGQGEMKRKYKLDPLQFVGWLVVILAVYAWAPSSDSEDALVASSDGTKVEHSFHARSAVNLRGN